MIPAAGAHSGQTEHPRSEFAASLALSAGRHHHDPKTIYRQKSSTPVSAQTIDGRSAATSSNVNYKLAARASLLNVVSAPCKAPGKSNHPGRNDAIRDAMAGPDQPLPWLPPWMAWPGQIGARPDTVESN